MPFMHYDVRFDRYVPILYGFLIFFTSWQKYNIFKHLARDKYSQEMICEDSKRLWSYTVNTKHGT